MIKLHLRPDEREALMKTLVNSHKMGVSVRVHDENEDTIASLTHPYNRVIEGAVQVDNTADITRSLSLSLLDPERKLRVEQNNPLHGALYANRFLSVHYEVYVYDVIQDWVSIPVFWGPMSSFERDGDQVNIEGQGKESLLLAPHYAVNGYSIKRRTRLDDAIREVAHRAGELRFNLPDLGHPLHRAYVVHSQAEPWKVIAGEKRVPGLTGKRIGKGKKDRPDRPLKASGLISHHPGNFFAFYNGEGRLTVRERNKDFSFSFHHDVHITSLPSVTYDTTEFRNYVHVKGAADQGKKPKDGHASLPKWHPLSPHSLARNGKLRFLAEFIAADGLTSASECKQFAEKQLKRLSMEGVDIAFETLPIPMLEEDDRIFVTTDEYSIPFHVKQFTIPLTSDSAMSIGYNKKVPAVHKYRRHGRRGDHHRRHHQIGQGGWK